MLTKSTQPIAIAIVMKTIPVCSARPMGLSMAELRVCDIFCTVRLGNDKCADIRMYLSLSSIFYRQQRGQLRNFLDFEATKLGQEMYKKLDFSNINLLIDFLCSKQSHNTLLSNIQNSLITPSKFHYPFQQCLWFVVNC